MIIAAMSPIINPPIGLIDVDTRFSLHRVLVQGFGDVLVKPWLAETSVPFHI
jgi:hypothetical protein